MKFVIGMAAGLLLLPGLLGGTVVVADAVFTISDPAIDFEVIDADDGSGEFFFDGIGDFGPFPTYSGAVLGSFGAGRSMAEFDISGFSIPAGEVITSATFEIKCYSVGVWGLGIEGQPTDSIALDGYVGNGIEEVSDYQIADGNQLTSLSTEGVAVNDIMTFPITAFVTQMVNDDETWLGLTIRAETFGGHMFNEGNGYPKLTITTGIPEPATLALGALVALMIVGRRTRR